jgi:hypothetical protein
MESSQQKRQQQTVDSKKFTFRRRKRAGMSATVRARIERRRETRWNRIAFFGGFATVCIVAIALTILDHHESVEARRMQSARAQALVDEAKLQTAKITAPTWADFQGTSSIHEYVRSVDKNGVPLAVWINGERWSIANVPIFNDALTEGGRSGYLAGETYCAGKTIAYIDADNPAQLRENLMHEIFHAGACLHGGDRWWNSPHPETGLHPGVYHLGMFMAEFARTNPVFVKWLVGDGEGAR